MSQVVLLQSIPVPEIVWEKISMDFIDGLLVSQGYSAIMVVVDRLMIISAHSNTHTQLKQWLLLSSAILCNYTICPI